MAVFFQWLHAALTDNALLMVFLIAVLGYLIGSIKICGLDLGRQASCWWL